MAQDKVKLRKFINLISEIASLQGNEWFIRELLCEISEQEAQKITGKTVNEVYEYCLKNVIREQAEGFYSDFAMISIKQKLIDDFVQMERFRRENNFEEFCEALFEQVEGIVRVLFTEEIKSLIIERCDYLFCGSGGSADVQKQKYLWQLVFGDSFKKEWLADTFNKKASQWGIEYQLSSILYAYYYGAPSNGVLNCVGFDIIKKIAEGLLVVRDMNSHRSASFKDYKLKLYKKAVAGRYRLYLVYLSFLEDFTKNINKNISRL